MIKETERNENILATIIKGQAGAFNYEVIVLKEESEHWLRVALTKNGKVLQTAYWDEGEDDVDWEDEEEEKAMKKIINKYSKEKH